MPEYDVKVIVKEIFTLTLDEKEKLKGAKIVVNPQQDEYEENTPITIKITLPDGYQVESFNVNDVPKLTSLENKEYSFKINENTNISVKYKKQAKITTTGKGLKTEPENYADAYSPVTITVTPPKDKRLTSLKVGGEEKISDKDLKDINGDGTLYTYNFDIEEDTDIVAEYEINYEKGKSYLELTGEGLTANKEQGNVDNETEITITVKPEDGKEVATFTVNDEDQKGELKPNDEKTEYTFTFKLTEHSHVKVTYQDKVEPPVAPDPGQP